MMEFKQIEFNSDEYRMEFTSAQDSVTITDEPAPEERCVQVDGDVATIVSMLKKAHEKHLPVLISNADNTRAFYFPDANAIRIGIDLENKIPAIGL